jgi:O-antigen/teichoic acid export membrane protein
LVYLLYTIDVTVAVPGRDTFVSLLTFAKYSVLSVIKGQAFSWTDIVVMGFFLENAVIGVYQVSWTLAMAFLLFGNVVQQNLFPKISEVDSTGPTERVRELISESFVYVGVLPIAGVVGAALLGQQVLSIYGPEFTRGGTVLTVLVLVALLRSYEAQIHAMLDGIDRPDLTFRLNVVFTVTNIALNLVLIPLYGAVGAAAAAATAVGLNVVLGWWLSTELVDIRFPGAEVAKQVLAALLMGAVVFAAMSFVDESQFVYTLVLIGLGAATYFGALLVLSVEIRSKTRQIATGFVG